MAVENLGSRDSVWERVLCASSVGEAAGASLSVVSGSACFVGSSGAGCAAGVCDVVSGWAGESFMTVVVGSEAGCGRVACGGSFRD